MFILATMYGENTDTYVHAGVFCFFVNASDISSMDRYTIQFAFAMQYEYKKSHLSCVLRTLKNLWKFQLD